MPKISIDGADWQGQKIGNCLNGIIGATTFFLLEWLLPRWLKESYTIYDYLYRARSADRHMKDLSHSKKARVVWFAVSAICFAVLKVYVVPSGREISLHHGILGYALQYLITVVLYLVSDGPPDGKMVSMYACRDAAVCYFLTVYCLIHRWWVWSVFCSALVWALLPLACISGSLWLYWDRLPGSVRLAVVWPLRKAGTLFMTSWDLWDKVEAHLSDRIPNWLSYRLHRFQQNRRRHTPTYVYSPIQPREIRLLRMRRTRWWLFGSIEATLTHVGLYDQPEYEAVSYRWGSPERSEEIVLDGAIFLVTRSAYDLLTARRSIWRTRTIWIDAICINQLDEQEKADQVQLMREIFQRASRVIVFPGGDWTARLAAPLLYETVAATFQFDDSLYELNKLTSSERRSTKWKALKNLILNDYFTRAWVVQEVAVGQTVQLYHGGLYIDLAIFLQLAMHLAHPHRREMLTLGDQDDGLFLETSSLENIAVMAFLRPDYATVFGTDSAERNGLDAVLCATFTFRATDPRDKVFAVLGIAKYEDRDGLLVPDYTKPVSEVYRDTAEHLFFHTDKPAIHMLALAGIGNGHLDSRLLIPSWVPDLNQERMWFPHTDFLIQAGSFRASGESQAEIKKGSIPNSLSIKGIPCDVVSSLGITTVHPGELRSGGQFDATYATRHKHRIIKDIHKTIQKHRDQGPGVNVDEEGLWLALVAGRIERKRPSPDHDWQEVFRTWLQVLEFQTNIETDQALDLASGLAKSPEFVTYDGALEGCMSRRFAITQQGRICWVPPYAEIGDNVFIPLGAQTPFLVRQKGRVGDQEVFELVGEAYVQGVMWGETVKLEHEVKEITLV